jgi:polyisoprenoid-binding protein YceI
MRYLPYPEVAMSLFVTIIFALSSPASADRFTGDNNSGQLQLEMDSTMHKVPIDATRFTTELNIDEKVTGKLIVQAAGLKTGIGVRDSRMYELCLSSDKYPTVVYEVRGVTGDVDGLKSGEGTGNIELHGSLTIRSTTRDIKIPATYNWQNASLGLTGKQQVSWADYSVPDPSIVISKVNPKMDMDFSITLNKSL